MAPEKSLFSFMQIMDKEIRSGALQDFNGQIFLARFLAANPLTDEELCALALLASTLIDQRDSAAAIADIAALVRQLVDHDQCHAQPQSAEKQSVSPEKQSHL